LHVIQNYIKDDATAIYIKSTNIIAGISWREANKHALYIDSNLTTELIPKGFNLMKLHY
jgi:hypothetical protein